MVNTLSNGNILNITVLKYYEGTLHKKIKSGMTFDSIKNLPNEIILNEIVVADFTWWFKPNLKPEYAK